MDENNRKKSIYEEYKSRPIDERIRHEFELILSEDTNALHDYMDGLIVNICKRMGKENDSNFYEKLHKKVDEASSLYRKRYGGMDTPQYLFSSYFTYFVNEVLSETGQFGDDLE